MYNCTTRVKGRKPSAESVPTPPKSHWPCHPPRPSLKRFAFCPHYSNMIAPNQRERAISRQLCAVHMPESVEIGR